MAVSEIIPATTLLAETIGSLHWDSVAVLVTLILFAVGHLILANRWGGRMESRVEALHRDMGRIEQRLDEWVHEIRLMADRRNSTDQRLSVVEERVSSLRGDVKDLASRITKVEGIPRT